MGEILTGIRVFISISESELKLEFEQMEARISIKSCIKLISGRDEMQRETHTLFTWSRRLYERLQHAY